MKRLVLMLLLMLGIVATSYNNGKSVREVKRPPTFVEDFNRSLDSLNRALDEKSN